MISQFLGVKLGVVFECYTQSQILDKHLLCGNI